MVSITDMIMPISGISHMTHKLVNLTKQLNKLCNLPLVSDILLNSMLRDTFLHSYVRPTTKINYLSYGNYMRLMTVINFKQGSRQQLVIIENTIFLTENANFA